MSVLSEPILEIPESRRRTGENVSDVEEERGMNNILDGGMDR